MKSCINTIVLITIIGVAFGMTSCKKRKLNKSTITSQDNAIAEMVFNDAFKVTEDAMKENKMIPGGWNRQREASNNQ